MEQVEKTMRERMLAGDLYLADDPALARDSLRAQRLTHLINTMDPTDQPKRVQLLTELLGSFGQGSEIRPPLHCDDVATITIGDDVQMGPNVQLLTATHPLDPAPRRDKWEAAEPIVIGDNVWLGGGVIVCPGVSIGADTVVGAGAVVTRDIPAGVVAVGTPARVIRQL